MTNYQGKAAKTNPSANLVVFAFLGGLLLLLVVYFAFFNPSYEYLLQQLEVREAVIVEMDNSEKPWVRVQVPGLEQERELWLEVAPDFYNAHHLQDQVGVRLGNYNKFAVKKSEGKKYRKLVSQNWQMEEIYNTLADAQGDNVVKTYTTPGKVVGKEAKAEGSFLLLDIEGKQAKTIVEKSLFDKVKVGDTLQAKFESVGEFTRFLGVENSN
ncbi:MAG: hypothetical protein WA118_09075 [Carboxydocellales bacterium]